MNKAILVIDIPQRLLNSNKYYAEVNIKPQDRRKDWYEKTVEAELTPLPQKKDDTKGSSTRIVYCEGFNACIDEILGEEE